MKIGVLMGGISSERDISIQSGKAVLEALKKLGKDAFEIMIDHKTDVFEKAKGYDFIFIALHGQFGEDGNVQAILEMMNIPYSGCGVLTSALCMDKMQSKRVLRSEGIKVPKGMLFCQGDSLQDVIRVMGDFPYVIKPNRGGSSIGTFIVRNHKELEISMKQALNYDQEVLVEEYIKGAEYTIPMLEGNVLPIMEIIAEHSFFDYTCKYQEGKAVEKEAKLESSLYNEMVWVGEQCWKIFKCKSYVRIDIMVRDGQIYVIELNTLPGMTKNSLLPKSAQLCGMDYNALVNQMIECLVRN